MGRAGRLPMLFAFPVTPYLSGLMRALSRSPTLLPLCLRLSEPFQLSKYGISPATLVPGGPQYAWIADRMTALSGASGYRSPHTSSICSGGRGSEESGCVRVRSEWRRRVTRARRVREYTHLLND